MIADPVLIILYENILINDEVMQVQLLNLLKVLLFNTQNVHNEYKEDAIKIFYSQLFHECINLGIQINYIFVRTHFISFVECALPIFRDILNQEQNLNIASRLIKNTSDFLVRRVTYYNEQKKKRLTLSKNDSSVHSKLSYSKNKKDFYILKNYLDECKEQKSKLFNGIILIFN